MDVRTAERTSTGVGAATFAIGVAMSVSPERLGGAAGLDDRTAVQVIAVADLALVPGLLVGRPRWPWMAARSVLNVAIAARLLRAGSARARIVAGTLGCLTVVDSVVAATLRSARA